MIFFRTCDGPFYNGNPCLGSESESEFCSNKNCDDNCEYQEWSSWTRCSKQCGLGGTRQRSRNYLEGQENFACEKMSREIEPCFEKMCSDEFYGLDFIQVELSSLMHAGSDNSWKIRLWDQDRSLCMTRWLDR